MSVWKISEIKARVKEHLRNLQATKSEVGIEQLSENSQGNNEYVTKY